ncbi:hypothetical protein AOL_s00188g136 [Orbilia oligospora ATCC 24927]|uniref:Zn(2)-C6 fungal-type domain-containing protein n=1 Tax=Arthrobotrys oligospora (strain ATCC 24927 / CBS 115.81 / DSM 1491) TaxID=756982 RepID=G1XQC4_ARTOA|nr:hypothetical protein AOL_s00188g136 [Orbilia oligospora ATCC 24927]EGX44468.1 hypothetical protein AOL_s00188g136 [Orbilia oligospora ATCC 24927]
MAPIEFVSNIQLSCTKCRSRKVKCDRVQPCQSCCLRGEPDQCRFPSSETTDLNAVNQAYEIRRLRKELDSWKAKYTELQGQMLPSGPEGGTRDAFPTLESSKDSLPSPPTSNARTMSIASESSTGRRPAPGAELASVDEKSHLHFGAPGLTTVINEFTNMHVKTSAAQIHHIPEAIDILSARYPRGFPFPTLWKAVDGIAGIWTCLPPVDEVLAYVEAYRQRAQCAYPYIYAELQDDEVLRRFLEGGVQNAEQQPSLLALVLISIALGIQCSVYHRRGHKWVSGAMEEDRRFSEVYFAAAFQTLRIMGFSARPDALTLQTLLMMLPYLTNSGRCCDAWVVHGMAIRVAQSMGYHRDPTFLRPSPAPADAHVRRILWWWVLYQDVHLSMIFGRPLGVSGIGDVLPPELVTPMPTTFKEFVMPYTVLMRQMLSADELSTYKIDEITNGALGLLARLPPVLQFDPETWTRDDFSGPPWPRNMLAVLHASKVHNMVILLNKRRKDIEAREQNGEQGVGLQRILSSCRLILKCQEFMHKHARQGLLCWFSNQCWFNASMILGLNILDHREYPELESDKEELRKSYTRFQDEAYLGIHELAAIAVEHLGRMFQQVGIPMEGIEYTSHATSDTIDSEAMAAAAMAATLQAAPESDMDFGGIPQSFGYGLRIPDTLFKNGDICSNSWHRV